MLPIFLDAIAEPELSGGTGLLAGALLLALLAVCAALILIQIRRRK